MALLWPDVQYLRAGAVGAVLEDRRYSPLIEHGPKIGASVYYRMPVVVSHGATVVNIPAGTPAVVWPAGGKTFDARGQRWVTFTTPAGGHYVTQQDNLAAVGASADILPIEYSTLKGWRRWQPRTPSVCISTAPLMFIAVGNLAGGDHDDFNTAARFLSIGGMAWAPNGLLYLVDRGNQKIKTWSPITGAAATLLADAQIVDSGSSFVRGCAVAANGDLYYITSFDSGHQQIKRVPAGTSTPTIIAGATGGTDRSLPNTAGAYNLKATSLTVSLDQATLYVTEGVGFVVALDLAGGGVTKFAGSGVQPESDDTDRAQYFDPTLNANRITAMFPDPSDLWIGPDGSVLILSSDWSYLSRINLDGTVTRITELGSFYPIGDTGVQINTGKYQGDGGPALFTIMGATGLDFFGPLGGAPLSVDVSACFDICVVQPGQKVIRTIGTDLILHTLAGAQRDNVVPAVFPPDTLLEGETVGANSKQLPGTPICCRAIPRAYGGGLIVSCGNCLIRIV